MRNFASFSRAHFDIAELIEHKWAGLSVGPFRWDRQELVVRLHDGTRPGGEAARKALDDRGLFIASVGCYRANRRCIICRFHGLFRELAHHAACAFHGRLCR